MYEPLIWAAPGGWLLIAAAEKVASLDQCVHGPAYESGVIMSQAVAPSVLLPGHGCDLFSIATAVQRALPFKNATH